MNNADSDIAMVELGKITNGLCRQTLVKALAEFAGPERKLSREQVADAVDLDPRTMRAYALGEAMPTLPTFLRFCALFGPAFTNRFLRLAGIDGAARASMPRDDLGGMMMRAADMVALYLHSLNSGKRPALDRPALLSAMRALQKSLNEQIQVEEAALMDEPTPVVFASALQRRGSSFSATGE